MINKNYYAVIMAGGVGSRFWPVSTPEHPKQFHDMLGVGESLIQSTFNRLVKFIPKENIMVATNDRYKDLVMRHLPQIKEEQLLLEPAMRNTAPCILYSAQKIASINKDALMIVAPSDHYIENEALFSQNVKEAFDVCTGQNILMCLGIKPSAPNTGYGYIQYDKKGGVMCKVKNFTEKPNQARATEFLHSGDYLWNAGIFIWRVASIIKSFERNLPAMHALFNQGEKDWNTVRERDFIRQNYARAENISIDYGIMEKAENVYVMPTDFGWNDLGTWGSLYEKLPKDPLNNALVNAKGLIQDASNNIILTEKGKKIVMKGLDNFIVVETGDTLMIYPKSEEQQIKEISRLAESKFKPDH